MKNRTPLSVLAGACLLFCPPEVGRAQNEIGFLERFVLASDRLSALGELLPGSPDYYYYHALHAQNAGDSARFLEVLSEWTKRSPGENPGRRTLLHRQALLDFDKNPKATFAYLRGQLAVQFPHTRQTPDAPPALPSQLNESLLSVEAFEKDALRVDNLSTIPPYALDSWISRHASLSDTQRAALLDRIDFSDSPALVDLLAWDLKRENGRVFGSRRVHARLFSAQLDALAQKIPALAQDEKFVHARLRKVLPAAESDTDFDPAAREAWLDAVWKQVSGLPPAYNSIKAHVLYRRLEHDRSRGIYDRERFLEYLKLPKRSAYTNPEWLHAAASRSAECNLHQGFPDAFADPRPIGSDEALVREYFLRLFDAAAKARPAAGEELARPFLPYVQSEWLRNVLAEALITGGHGSPEAWASLLPPNRFQALKERIDVEFPADNPAFIAPGKDVRFDVWVKNVPILAVNVYDVNSLDVFLQQKRQVNTDLNLDGMVPTLRKSIPLEENVFLRRRTSITLPELTNRRGVWLVEVIGGNRSNRALLRIGHWRSIHQSDPAGVRVTLLDENQTVVRGAVAWLDGRRIESDPATGTITLPFLAPGPERPVVYSDSKGEFAMLESLRPQPEQFQLDAGFHLEREQMLAGADPVLGIRVALLLGSLRLDPALLKESTLRICSTTQSGVSSTLEIKDLRIPASGVLEQKIHIPEGTTALTAELSAKMDTISRGAGESVPLAASRTWTLNGIDSTLSTQQAFLFKQAEAGEEAWFFELIGKNGEPLAEKDFAFSFYRAGFQTPRHQRLKTDQAGRIRLGKLTGIQRVDAGGPGIGQRTWNLPLPETSWPAQIHAAQGVEIRIPVLPEGAWVDDWCLVEKQRDELLRSLREKVSVEKGFYVIRGLDPGDYLFKNRLKDAAVEIRVTSAPRAGDWFMGDTRQLQAGNASGGLHLVSLQKNTEDLAIRVAGAHGQTRVHVAARRFLDPDNLLESLGRFERWGLASNSPARLPNLYSAGRRIGDEYRYILERKNAEKFPGLMLPRPGLLLNPWETGDTETAAFKQTSGERALASKGDRMAKGQLQAKISGAAKAAADRDGEAPSASPNLQFLAEPARVLWNLKPDASGEIRIPLAALGDRHMVQIYAEDGRNFAWREIAVGTARAAVRDLRMLHPFDPAKRFTETRETTILAAGGSARFADGATTETESFGTLSDAFALLRTLQPGGTLSDWQWITRWPSLTESEKRARYSEFVSHELNLFLWRKDPAFFQAVVRPYLANKFSRTFVDAFLLEEDLSRHLEPRAYARLNSMEKALLAWRIPAEREAAVRHLREEVERAPLDKEQGRRLFDSALKTRAMATGERMEFNGREEQIAQDALRLRSNAAPAPNAGAVGSSLASAGAPPGGKKELLLLGAASPRSEGDAQYGRQAAKPASAAEPPGDAAEMDKRAEKNLLERGEQGKSAKDEFSPAKTSDAEFEVSALVARDEALARRKAVRGYYRLLGATKEFAESHYHKVRIAQQAPGLVPPSAFWQDFAQWIAGGAQGAFLSARFPEAAHNLNEALLVLAVLDLPFESNRPVLRREGAAAVLEAGSAAIVFHRQIQPVENATATGMLQVTQSFVRLDDRHTTQDGEKIEKVIEGEFLTQVAYASTVVVSNPSASPLKADLLWQIPSGALPLGGSQSTQCQPIQVGPFGTAMFEFRFYFPSPSPRESPGFVCHPASVTAAKRGTAQATALTFKVVERASNTDQKSWLHVSQNAKEEELFAFLNTHPLHDLDLGRIAWRCQEKTFFLRLYAFLKARHVWHPVIASYGLKHEDAASARDWLLQQEGFLSTCGPVLRSPLLTVDPVELNTYEHLEYAPLVNPRAHRSGSEWRIGNSAVRAQYLRLLGILAHKPRLEQEDRLALSTFLFLQDRFAEAQAWFSTVDPAGTKLTLQTDYMRAVLGLLHGRMAEARTIATRHAGHPVERWRSLFGTLLTHLDGAEGKTASAERPDKPDREKETDQLAGTEPSLDVETAEKSVKVTVRNLRRIQVKFYPTDPEFSFSASPFSREESGTFRLIKAAVSLEKEVPEGAAEVFVPIPESLAANSLMVEVLGAGLRKSAAYSATRMRVDFAENYGRLDVRDTEGKLPQAKVYVKVYARLPGGAVRFFKDGYTDIRGRFDYASLNGSLREIQPGLREPVPPAAGTDIPPIQPGEVARVQKFAVLVLGETGGSVIRELNAPSRVD